MTLWIVGCDGRVGAQLLGRCRVKGQLAVGTVCTEVDICKGSQVRAFAHKVAPRYIVNCAAYTNVDGAESHVDEAFAINAQGAELLAQVAKEVGSHFLHLSTDYVFGGTGRVPYKETDSCEPLNTYGKSKREGEKRVLEAHSGAGILRTSWLFGKRGQDFVSRLVTSFLKEKELRVVADQVGKLTYCPDLVEAILALLGTQGIVHFANEGAPSRYQIACELLDLAKENGLPVFCETIIPVESSLFPSAAARPGYSVLDTQKYCSLTLKPPRHWCEAAKEWLHDYSL